MAVYTQHNMRLAGVAACVPVHSVSNNEYTALTPEERALFIKTTGIENRRVAKPGVATSDLCYESAVQLLKKLNWKPEEIGVLVFISQSRDYLVPSTSTILQDRLGLSKTTIAFDISLGCSGYVYGLSVLMSLMSTSGIKKGLLLVGDISTLSLTETDKSSFPLFGDAGTATAIESGNGATDSYFSLGTDGSGYQAIIIPDGGARNPASEASFVKTEIEKGVNRNRLNLALNGLDVFNFSIKEIPPSLSELMSYTKDGPETIDFLVMHQANKLINETIRKKLKFDSARVPYSIQKYGNTSSASIPLTMVSEIGGEISKGRKKLMLSGFGVGLSWASVILETENLVVVPVIEMP